VTAIDSSHHHVSTTTRQAPELAQLLGQQHCTATEAFALLRTASQHRNGKLRDIAADIVTLVNGHSQDSSPFDQHH